LFRAFFHIRSQSPDTLAHVPVVRAAKWFQNGDSPEISGTAVLASRLALSLQLPTDATGQGGPMTCESETANVWAALLGLSFFIAATLTVGYWLYIYHDEAKQMQPFMTESCTAAQMILDDIVMPFQ
jgi:hypothetical protein